MKQLTQEQYQDLAILADFERWIEHLEYNIKENSHLLLNDEKLMQKLRDLYNDLMS